ncbi:hypothetical protein B0H13DRAFT_2305255 [Mycena leptocephala]|nr:hypothetical protein B0H13DRAFT_2313420 [Mycena leptocephala]KAJ7934798.1 hypothetical protein B0H13DRAFT_2305255 [Mycena leptocephala]
MPATTPLQNILEFTIIAAMTMRDISTAGKVPFLGGAATKTLVIVEVIKSLKSSKEEYTQIAEQIHEILTAIIVLYETTQIQGVVPPALLSNVVNFTETLDKLHVYLKAKQRGRLKRLFNLSENEVQVKAWKAELHRMLGTFRLQTRMSAASTMVQIQMDANENHKALMDFLATHPNIAHSDSASEASVMNSLVWISIIYVTGFRYTFWDHWEAYPSPT